MLATERPKFDDLVAALLAGFDRKNTPERVDAYWRGCHRMQLGTFERVVDRALSEHGPDEIPTPKRLWGIAAELRTGPAPQQKRPEPMTGADIVESYAGSFMFAILLGADGRNGQLVKPVEKGNLGESGRPASEESLRAMLKAKREIVASAVADEFTLQAFVTPFAKRTPEQLAAIGELRDVLLAAFEKAWKPRTAEETAADIEHFARTGFVRGIAPSEVSAALESAA